MLSLYNRHRYFDLATGSFISQDPIGLMGGINPYRYAPNTLRWADPLGLNCEELENQLPHLLEQELATAERLGVKPMVAKIHDPQFEALVNSGSIKYVVTPDGVLLVGPHSVNGVEISHAALSEGKPVVAAGQADIAGDAANGFFGLDINTHSGHYMNGASSVLNEVVANIGKEGFENAGIIVP
ncbi:RHS repeat-associated core domain-containing protein [Paraburkholderia rhizosphaerae]|uniref:RHS repeat-associated core domain-containing protein n=1 Tax=Paraburkholderia rhizosphaerae TaxID=480658 RepID=UPI0010661140|nr:RHS repeat-associated core domain-containing protein [Paraburkholderia rhizosphaerae]